MARIDLGCGTLLSPVPPVMVTVGDLDHANIITVAWTGILSSTPAKTYISVRPSRHSYGILKERGEFVIHLTPASLVKTADYCGIYTGAKVDKFLKCSLTKLPAKEVAAPIIAQCPLALECRVTDIVPLGSHDMFMADIVNVSADEGLLDQAGKLCLDRAELAAYSHGEYFALGKKLGSFGFSARKKKKPAPRAAAPRHTGGKER